MAPLVVTVGDECCVIETISVMQWAFLVLLDTLLKFCRKPVKIVR